MWWIIFCLSQWEFLIWCTWKKLSAVQELYSNNNKTGKTTDVFVHLLIHVKLFLIVIYSFHMLFCWQTNWYRAAAEEQHSQSILNSYSMLSTYIISSWFSQPQVIRKPGQGSADDRERFGLTESNKVIKHKRFAVCVSLQKSCQILNSHLCQLNGYLGSHPWLGDPQPITKLIPVGPYCGKVTLPGTNTQHNNVSHTYQKAFNNKRIFNDCIRWDH